MGNVTPVLAPSGAVAVPGEDTAPAPDEVVPAAADAEENAGGEASEMAHVAELEATLLAASSPEREGPRSPRPPSQPRLQSLPPKPRSEGRKA
jgi:hypothetical protein